MFKFNNALFRFWQRRFFRGTRYQTYHFLVKLFGKTMLDAIVLRYDPLVVVLVRTAGKGARKLWLALRGVPRARNKSKHPFPEMFFNKMFVKVEGCDANNFGVVTHEALHPFARLSILVSRVLKMTKSVVKSILPLA